MQRRLFSLICICVLGHISCAQQLYPIRDNGKWGYVDDAGKVKVPAVYDAAFPFVDSITRVVRDGRSFFINQSGQESAIAGISNFEIIRNNMVRFYKGHLMGVANFNGDIIISPRFKDLRLMYPSPLLFQFRDGDSIGFVSGNDSIAVPAKFTRVFPDGNIIRLMMTDSMGFFIRNTGTYVEPYFDDVVEDFGRIFVRDEEGWHQYFEDGDTAARQAYKWLRILHIDYVEVAEGNDTSLLYLPEQRIIMEHIDGHYRSQRFFLAYSNGKWQAFENGISLMDSMSDIRLLGVNIMKATKDSLVNYWHMDHFVFDEFVPDGYPLGNGYYGKGDGKAWGVMYQNGDEVLDCAFRQLRMDGNVIKALDDERNLHMIEVDSGRVVEQMVFTNYRTVFADRFEGGAIVSSVDRGNWFRTRKGWGLMDDAGNTLIRPQYTHYNEIDDNYALVYRNYNKPFGNIDRFTRLLPNFIMGLVDMRDGSYFIPMKYLYIDTASFFDSTLDVVRVMSTFGTYKNIDKQTKRVYSYGATFMSPFREGLARVYLGGHLTTKDVIRNECFGTIFSYLSTVNLRVEDTRRLMNNLQRNRSSNPDGFMMCAGGQWALIGKDGKYVIHPTKEKEEQIAYLEGVGNGYSVFRKNNLYGIMDSRGKVTLKDEHLQIYRMSSGDSVLFTVLSRKSKYRYYHPTGQALSNESFDRGLPFTDDITWVRKGNRYMILSRDGNLHVPEKNPKRVRAFHDGVSPALVNRKWQLVNNLGKVISEPREYRYIGESSSGLVPYLRVPDDTRKRRLKYGFMNTDGEEVIEPLFQRTTGFAYGYGVVANKRNKWALIDREGGLLTRYRYNAVRVDSSGWVYLKKKNRHGLYNPVTDLTISPRYSEIHVSENRIAARRGNKLVVFDLNGKRVFKMRGVSDISEYSEGKLAVSFRYRRSGYLDTAGKLVIDPVYMKVWDFKHGRALVQDQRRLKIIDEQGEVLSLFTGRVRDIKSEGLYILKQPAGGCRYISNTSANPFGADFRHCQPFENGLARVSDGEKWGAIDHNGTLVLPIEYDRVEIGLGGYLKAGSDWQYGVIRGDGREVVDARFDAIQQIDDNVIRMRDGSELSYIRFDGSWIWKGLIP